MNGVSNPAAGVLTGVVVKYTASLIHVSTSFLPSDVGLDVTAFGVAVDSADSWYMRGQHSRWYVLGEGVVIQR